MQHSHDVSLDNGQPVPVKTVAVFCCMLRDSYVGVFVKYFFYNGWTDKGKRCTDSMGQYESLCLTDIDSCTDVV